MVASAPGWVPDAGDLVWVELGPVAGNEQDGRRPVLVLSPAPINELTRRIMALPITRKGRNWPTEIELPDGCQITGFVQCDQIRSLSWQARHARKAGDVDMATLERARGLVGALIGTG